MLLFRKISHFVPCLVENEADYEAMSHCPEREMFISAIVSRFDHLMTWREMFNMTIDFLDTVNDIVCTRTDGKWRHRFKNSWLNCYGKLAEYVGHI